MPQEKNIAVKLARLQCFQPIKSFQLGGTPLRVWSIPYGGGEAWQATDPMNGPEGNVWRKQYYWEDMFEKLS